MELGAVVTREDPVHFSDDLHDLLFGWFHGDHFLTGFTAVVQAAGAAVLPALAAAWAVRSLPMRIP